MAHELIHPVEGIADGDDHASNLSGVIAKRL